MDEKTSNLADLGRLALEVGMRIRTEKRRNGQGLVEFAMILPILMLLLLGIIEFSRMMFSIMMASTAALEGVRYGIATGVVDVGGTYIPRYVDCNGIENNVMNLGRFAGITSSHIEITYDEGPDDANTTDDPTCTYVVANGLEDTLLEGQKRVVVDISVPYEPLFGLVPPGIVNFFQINNFNITAEAARTIVVYDE